MQKPTGKAISVTSFKFNDYIVITIVFDDGSIWEYSRGGGDDPNWDCIYSQ